MAVPPQRVDIVPSRLMAAPAEFDSYQLDSKHFPIITSTLREERSVCEPQTHDTQFSMQHLLTAASAEQLIWDPYQTTAEIHTFYTVTKDKTGETFFSLWSFNVRTRKWIQQDHNICSWPAPTDGRPAYPCSCKVTQRFVIVNTGVDKLLIFDKAGSNGKDVAAIRTISAVLEPGVIADARWDSQIGHLNVLLQDVEEINREGQNTVYGSRLTWLTILPTDNAPDDRNQPQPEEFIHEKLRPVRKRVILVEGNMEMATFSTANEIVVVASSKPYMVLVLDSVDLHTDDTVIGRRILHAKRKRGIKANIPDEEPMEEYKEPEMSVEEAKKEAKEDEKPAEMPEEAKKTEEGDEKFAEADEYNQDLEECDVSEEASMNVYWAMEDWQGNSGFHVTRQASITGHQRVFTVKMNPEESRLLCLRHDPDGTLWKLDGNKPPTTNPAMHLKTFPAFGYIQASKTNRKFSSCSPDLSYTVIVDRKRYAYIFWPDKPINANLVRRSVNGQRKVTGIASSNVISLNLTDDFNQSKACDDPIVGFLALDSALYLMTTKNMFVVILKDLALMDLDGAENMEV